MYCNSAHILFAQSLWHWLESVLLTLLFFMLHIRLEMVLKKGICRDEIREIQVKRICSLRSLVLILYFSKFLFE